MTAAIPTAIAQTVDPLLLDRNDSLIPQGYGRRKLSSFEKYRIQKEIIKLDKAALDELDRGNTNSAVELWYRRLRLTRLINPKAEIQALGKVGAIFWSENRSEDIRNIANRLMAIQAEQSAEQSLPSSLLEPLAMAYESVRYFDKAIDVYQQFLVTNKAQKNQTLNKLGKLHLSIFDYDGAAEVYQQKLQQNISKEERETVLKTLIEIYDLGGKSQKSLAAKKRLLEQYTIDEKSDKIPALEMAIALDYATSNQPRKAIKAYTRAFSMASDRQQLAIASDALMGMGKLYQKRNNIEQAIDTYDRLLTVQQQSYDLYGLINTYDTLGKISLKSNQRDKAKQYFKQGLEIAKTLDYKIEYFRDQIEIK